jgi:predicted type IV restriction endonuclease
VIQLNLPGIEFKSRTVANQLQIFDPVRRKYVALTPEEWVRQHFVHFLVKHRNVPMSHITVEKSIRVSYLAKRADIIVYKGGMKPVLAVECKAPSVEINEEVFYQVLRYNMALRVDYLIVTNGLRHIYCKVNYEHQKAIFIEDLPFYDQL